MYVWIDNYIVPLVSLVMGLGIGFCIGFLLALVNERK